MEILSLELLSSDLEKTKSFYRDQLHMEVAVQNDNSVSFVAGNTELTFTEDKSNTPVYHFAFNIPPHQLDEALKTIDASIGVMEIGDGNKIAEFTNWNARSFYFFDATGNILEFIARFDLEDQIHDAFNFNSILCISEIGIVANNVTKAAADLINRYRFTPYVKQPVLENFAAIGDHHGMIILSATGRNWYPTSIPARNFKTGIKIRENGKVRELFFNA